MAAKSSRVASRVESHWVAPETPAICHNWKWLPPLTGRACLLMPLLPLLPCCCCPLPPDELKSAALPWCFLWLLCFALLRPFWLAAVATATVDPPSLSLALTHTHTHTERERVRASVCLADSCASSNWSHFCFAYNTSRAPRSTPWAGTIWLTHTALLPSSLANPYPLAPLCSCTALATLSCCSHFSCYTSIVIQVRATIFVAFSVFYAYAQLIFHTLRRCCVPLLHSSPCLLDQLIVLALLIF